MSYDVHKISNPVCDAWIAGVSDLDVEYCYGGTRVMPSWASNLDAEKDLVRLMYVDSHLKNRMINRALGTNLLADLAEELPKGFLGSRVGGGRCILRPRTEDIYRILSDPAHPDFSPMIAEVFREVGELLNRKGGRIKLTPEFGRFAGVADELAMFTPHVLGVRCNAGGCGGSAPYTVTGIVSALQALGLLEDNEAPVTLIGSAGVLGRGVLEYFQQHWFKDLAVCDLAYDDGTAEMPEGDVRVLRSERGRFTRECLERGGTIICTTWGEELESSDIDAIPRGTSLILAHNLSTPGGRIGSSLMRQIASRGIFALPGQLLTLGGTLTPRLEWFWRQSHPNADFTGKKKLAHLIAARVGAFLVEEVDELVRRRNLTPLEAMWAYAREEPEARPERRPPAVRPRRTVVAGSNLVEVLRGWAETKPEAEALLFLKDGEREATHRTYAELDRRAREIAASLQWRGLRGKPVLLLYPPGADLVEALLGCFYAGAISVPVHLPGSGRALPRLEGIVRDARPAAVLTTSALRVRSAALWEGIAAGEVLTTDGLSGEEDWSEPDLRGEGPAFLQYTSGSTDSPKGVVVTHRSLLLNQEMIRRAFGSSEQSVVVSWLPLQHDMGLIGGLLHPLFTGARCVLMSPAAFLQRPARWLEAISRYRATASGGPNFAYELCLRKVSAEERGRLDLSSWRAAFNGAEPVRAGTLERFAEAFAPCGFRPEAFRPCYGLAEATLLVSAGRGAAVREVAPGQRLVSCGSPGMELEIVDPETRRHRPEGEVGEIWVAGPSVAGGYWHRADETCATFRARLADECQAGPFLRTGDLGLLAGGELFVAGRLKDLVILRGRNHYPQDLERTAEECHPELRPGGTAVFGAEVDGEERLVVVQEVAPRFGGDTDAVAGAILQAIAAEHEVQPYEVLLVEPGAVPRTTSGKVRRQACRGSYLEGSLPVVYRRRAGLPLSSELDRGALLALDGPRRKQALDLHLRDLVARWTGAPLSRVDSGRSLASLGLDSLAMMEVRGAVETGLGVPLALHALAEAPSLADLRELVLDGLDREAAGRGPIPTGGAAAGLFPLSEGQKALWAAECVVPGSGVYNIAVAARVEAGLEIPKLREALRTLVVRHPSLRTRLVAAAGRPYQEAVQFTDVDLVEEDASSWPEPLLRARLLEEAYRPFPLASGTLLRLRVYDRGGERFVLLVVHHLAADFWSLAVVLRELSALYRGEALAAAPPAVGYAGWVDWQTGFLAGERAEGMLGYWRREVDGARPLDLPADRRRPPVPTFRAGLRAFRLDPGLTERVRSFGGGRGVTLYVTLLAALQALLGRFGDSEDFLVGSPVAGRPFPELAEAVGYFVNPVPLRARLEGGPSFEEHLARTRRAVLGALENQEYPSALLPERLGLPRQPGRPPLFQVLFVLQRAHGPELAGLAGFGVGVGGARLRLGELTLESLFLAEGRSPFDLVLSMAEGGEGLVGTLAYSADLFDEVTAGRLAGALEALLAGAVAETAGPGARLASLPLLSSAERQQLLVEWTDARAEPLDGGLLHELFEAQADRRPDAVAVVRDDFHLSYAGLEARVNQVAHRLRGRGVGLEGLVGICLERSPELVIGLFGILKAGAAYVPLDPEYPRERRLSMVEDAGVSVVLTQEDLRDLSPQGASRPVSGATGGNAAYVIYTSGSTGRPKGVVIHHAGIVNHMRWMDRELGLGPGDRLLQKTPAGFDASVWELFAALASGGCLVLARPGGHREPVYLAGEVERQQVTVLQGVPSLLRVLLEEPELERRCRSLRRVVSGGEPLGPEVVARFFERLSGGMVNVYGPTEATINATFWRCRPRAGAVPIGRPIANSEVYLLDRGLEPVPMGLAGELCLGGAGVGRGYLGRPELTAERFVPHPFGGPGERLYRTGDLARWTADGSLAFVGRVDHQAKVRGVRVEPGDVEAALLQHPGVLEAAVAARPEHHGPRLSAYVVPRERCVPPSAGELRTHLLGLLPEPLVPSWFVVLDSLPRSPGGKVDRAALPAPGPLPAERPRVDPRTPAERAVAEIWSELLGVDRVGIHDNFFELGGHSLLATQVASRVRQAFGVELPLRQLFEAPTVADVAEALNAALWRQGTVAARPDVGREEIEL